MLKKLQQTLLKSIIPIVNIHGIISTSMTDHVAESLKNINTDRAKALAVSINSRGGSPVQSELILNKLKYFAHKHHLQLWTFAEDICASGGYYILSGGDRVYADRSSIVGSIGVVSNRFDLKGILNYTQIQRRKISSNQKLILDFADPFVNPNQQTREMIKKLGHNIHLDFINQVQKNRGSKIKVSKEERANKIYNGDVFDGQEAAKLGLVDQVGAIINVLSQEFPESKLKSIQIQNFRKWLNI